MAARRDRSTSPFFRCSAVFNFDHHMTNHFLDIENVVLEFVFYLCF